MREPLTKPPARTGVALAVAAVLAGCGAAGAAVPDGLRGASTLPPGIAQRPAPPITGRDAWGARVSSAALRGRPYAVTFLYAHCRDVCPIIAQEVGDAIRQLGTDARRVSVLAVSVDPAGDTPRVVRAFLRRHRAPSNFRYVIGPRTRLASIWRAFHTAPQPAGDPQGSHTAVVWLVDRRGRLAGAISGGARFRPEDLAHDFRVLLHR
jgi:protein SCO1/2